MSVLGLPVIVLALMSGGAQAVPTAVFMLATGAAVMTGMQ